MLARLLHLLFPVREDERFIEEESTESFLALLAPEAVGVQGQTITTLLPFTDSRVRAAVHEAKYRGHSKAFVLLAAVLSEYLRELAADGQLKNAVLVPVPLGPARRKARGFNQVEEVLKIVAKESQLPLASDALIRTRETISQISLPRHKRQQNMRGAFGAASSLSPTTTYIVVDDVTTTGATLLSAASALKSASAENIIIIALAH